MSFFNQYKPYIIFSFLIIFGFAVFILISGGYYPILSVNGSFVSARTFWKNYQANSVYYQKFIDAYRSSLEDKSKIESVNPNELKKLALTQIVENILIGAEVEKELGNDLDAIVSNRISKIDGDKELKKAAEGVYGLNFTEFKDEILVPLAKEEILTGRLFLEGKKLSDWLDAAKKSSQVKIFSGQFFWDGKEVQLKKPESPNPKSETNSNY